MMRIALVAVVVVIADQASKWAMLRHVFDLPFDRVGPFLPLAPSIEITGFFNLATVWNRGVGFGMFGSAATAQPYILSALALALSVGLLFWLRHRRGTVMDMATGLVCGGAVGNVIDRLRLGAVFDFLDFHAFALHWPAFNLADAAIVCGAALLALLLWREDKKTLNL